MSATLAIDVPSTLWLSSNDRHHWAETARRTKALRQLGFASARNAGLRDLGTCHVAAFIGYPRNGRADPANSQPTTKALIDGLVDAGVWPDDDHTHVLGPTFLRGPATKRPGIHHVRFVMTAQDIPWETPC